MNVNPIVAVTFLDHAEDSMEPVEAVVYGRLVEEAPGHVVINCWESSHSSEPRENKFFSIVRPVKITELMPCSTSRFPFPPKPR